MGVIVSKFWRFCVWLEGGEGLGLIAETRVLEGNYRRIQQEGLLNILEAKLGGVTGWGNWGCPCGKAEKSCVSGVDLEGEAQGS